MPSFLLLLLLPITILNVMGGIGSGIWLALIGKWDFIGTGLLAGVASSVLLPFFLMPSMLLSIPAQSLVQRGSVLLGSLLLILPQVYTYGIIATWCMSVFYFCMKVADANTFLPLLFWSYGVGLSPLMAISRREAQAGMIASTMTTLFAQLGFIALIACALLSKPSFQDLVVVFSSVFGLGLIAQTGIAVVAMLVEARSRTGMVSQRDRTSATGSVAAVTPESPMDAQPVSDRVSPRSIHPSTKSMQNRDPSGSVAAGRQREAFEFELHDFVVCERYGPGQVKAVNPTAKVMLVEFRSVGAPMPLSVREAGEIGLRVLFRPK